MKNLTWILDPGHGGLGPGGEYLTKGKQSPEVPPGIYEGEFNRDIANQVGDLCYLNNIPYTILNPGPISVFERYKVQYANELHSIRKNCIYLAIHANAKGYGEKWYDARGFNVFHYPGSIKGKKLANALAEKMNYATSIPFRDVSSRKSFVLRKTSMPAILLESGFMTNRDDVAVLASDLGRSEIATAIFSMITNS